VKFRNKWSLVAKNAATSQPKKRPRIQYYSWRLLDAFSTAELLRVVEMQLQFGIVQWLRDVHPGVPFKADTSAIKTTIGTARKMAKLGNTPDWPDIFIAVPAQEYHGLFMEFKRDGTRIKNGNGEYATPHLAAQAAFLETLRKNGYAAEFAVGWVNIRKLAESYLAHAGIMTPQWAKYNDVS